MNPDHLHKLFDFDQYWPSLGPLVDKKLSKIGILGHSKENSWKDWSEMWRADVFWPHLKIVWFWPVLALWWSKKLSEIGVSGHCENTWKEWLEIWHAIVSWQHSELIQFWPNFGSLVAEKHNEIGFSGILKITHGRNGPKFGMQVCDDHFQNWWDFGHGLMIVQLLLHFWLSEMDQIQGFLEFSGEHLEGMAYVRLFALSPV